MAFESMRHDYGDGYWDEKPTDKKPVQLSSDKLVPTRRKPDPRYTFTKSFAPGKLATESDIKKSNVLPSDPRFDPLNREHAPRSAAARDAIGRTSSSSTGRPTEHVVGDSPVARLKHNDVVHFFVGDGDDRMVYHGRVRGLNATHLVVETPDVGRWTVPRSHAHPGVYPTGKREQRS